MLRDLLLMGSTELEPELDPACSVRVYQFFAMVLFKASAGSDGTQQLLPVEWVSEGTDFTQLLTKTSNTKSNS